MTLAVFRPRKPAGFDQPCYCARMPTGSQYAGIVWLADAHAATRSRSRRWQSCCTTRRPGVAAANDSQGCGGARSRTAEADALAVVDSKQIHRSVIGLLTEQYTLATVCRRTGEAAHAISAESRQPNGASKSFWFFFSKKNCFLGLQAEGRKYHPTQTQAKPDPPLVVA